MSCEQLCGVLGTALVLGTSSPHILQGWRLWGAFRTCPMPCACPTGF